MKFLKYIYPAIVLLMAGGCSEENQFPSRSDITVEDDCIRLDVSLNVAAIKGAQTRGFSDTPDYSKLKLYVFEFSDEGNPRSNALSENYTDSISDYAVNAGDRDIHFTLTLRKHDTPRILHFIATEDQDLQFTPNYEGYMIPSIQTSDGTPAYWHRIVFPNGYGEYDASGEKFTPYETLTADLEHIPMISNFAKVSLTSTAADFTYEGFALLNRPVGGTVCPWNIDKAEFPEFLNGKNILDYDVISENYQGYWPYNPEASSFTDRSAADATFDTDDRFMYERPNSSLYTPVVIMKGRRAGDTESSYYKIDLGRKNENNLFEYYDILRNFEYSINVTQVGAQGYATPQDAMNGVVYNNFSFDVNTRNMLNVSDGNDMLRVNQTTFVVTQDDQTDIELLFKYNKDIKNANTLSNGDIKFIVDEGTAIESVDYGTTDNADGWRTVSIKTVNPDGVRKEGSIVVYDPATGLGRTITIIVRNPWLYTSAGVWGGNYNYYSQFIANVEEREQWNGYVSSNAELGQPLTVRFHIPDDIPEAMFPMTFTFESDRQNIENNKVGNLVVEYGPGYFNSDETTIKYTKTVTWADYNSQLVDGNEQGTIVDDDNDGVTNHVVRARFQTIAQIEEGQTTLIRVYNPYMRVSATAESPYLEVSFQGKEGTAPDYESGAVSE